MCVVPKYLGERELEGMMRIKNAVAVLAMTFAAGLPVTSFANLNFATRSHAPYAFRLWTVDAIAIDTSAAQGVS